MKKNKMFKIMLTVLLLVVIVGTAGSVFADNTIDDPFVGVTPTKPDNENVTNGINSIAGQILFIAQMIGMAVATIMLIVLGIKYITASPDGKAEIKKSAWIYVVGALGIFAATFIVGIIKDVFTNL